MATVIKDAFLAVGRAIKQPVDSLANRSSRGAFVKHDSDIFSVKPDFLQNTAHEKDVVHAAFQPRRGIGIIVDADEQRAPPALLHRALVLRASAGKGTHTRPLCEHAINVLPRQITLEITGVTGELVQIDNGIMAGDRVVPGNFLEIRNTIDDPMSENRIALVKQMKPILLINPADFVVEMRGFEERVGDLR